MRTVASIGCLIAFLSLAQIANAQVSVGLALGADFDTDATMAGGVVRVGLLGGTVGVTGEIGESETSGEPKADVWRISFPVSYPFALNEDGDVNVFPFVAPGFFGWGCDGCDSQSEFTLEAGAGFQYKIVFTNGFFQLGDRDLSPKFGARLGFLFTLGR